MTERTKRLRQESLDAAPALTAERAVLMTEFYQANEGKYSVPVMRARSFMHLCRNKAIWLGDEELIVGERGPKPKVVPTYPELTCHSSEDLHILDSRPKTSYSVSDECIKAYQEKVIPYWRGRSMRDRIFQALPAQWVGPTMRASSRSSWSSEPPGTPSWTARFTARACWASSATSPRPWPRWTG